MRRPGATGQAPSAPVPGTLWDRTSGLGRVLGAVDDAGDALFAPWRGRRAADASAALASNLSDHGVVWVALAVVQGWRKGPSRRRAVLALAGAGFASYGVNRTVKRLAGRERPEGARPGRAAGGAGGAAGPGAVVVPVRRPSSTSFPSGHVLAAFCTALVLPATRAGRGLGLAFATLVAASRVHLRAHHTSDVLGGAVVGAATAAAVRPLVEALAAGRHAGVPSGRRAVPGGIGIASARLTLP